MNIFMTSKSPRECAQALDDLRLNKMILETAQILCTALPELYSVPTDAILYKPTHRNHPSVRWAVNSKSNFTWLVHHFYYLNSEREMRTRKTHLSYAKLWDLFCDVAAGYGYQNRDDIGPYVAISNITIREQFKDDPYEMYREWLRTKWAHDKREPTWIKRGQPDWR
jgi:hypothetical protein